MGRGEIIQSQCYGQENKNKKPAEMQTKLNSVNSTDFHRTLHFGKKDFLTA